MHTFKDLLATTELGRMSHWHKEAQALGQADDTQFENDFSKLAFMFLQDRAAPLMPYYLGFETVDRSEDGSRAVGIFGFKLGNDYYYIPAFFLNNQVKGVDILFKKSTNTFMPLTEDWVNYVLNRQTVELGGAAQNPDQLQGDFDAPNFDFLQHPRVGPLGYHDKHAEADLYPGSKDGLWSLYTAWEAMQKTASDGIKFDEGFMPAWKGFVAAWQHKPVEKAASSELISDFISKVGGPRATMTLLKTFGFNGVKVANAALRFYTGIDAFRVARYDKDCYLVKKAQAEHPECLIELAKTAADEMSARELIEQGFVIKDKRPSDRKSEVYEVDYDKDFGNPTVPGKYKVLCDDNEFRDAYVLNDALNGGWLIYWDKDNTFTYAGGTKDIIVLGGPDGDVDGLYNKASKATSMNAGENTEERWESPNNRYVIVGPSGKTAGVFTCYNVKSEDGKRVRIQGYGNSSIPSCHDDARANSFYEYWANDRYHDINGLPNQKPDYCCPSSSYDSIELADFKGTPKTRNGVLILPSDWKVVKVTDSNGGRGYGLGSDISITDNLIKNAFHKLRIHSDGERYHLSMDRGFPGKPLSLKQASLKLVTSVGIDAHKAAELLKRAASEHDVTCFVKMAQFVGVSMPTPPGQAGGVDPYTGIPQYEMPYITETQGPMTGVPMLPDPDQQGFNIGGSIQEQSGTAGPGAPGEAGVPELDPETLQLSQQAGEIGQKQVFDHAAIGGLAKVYDVSAVINSYLPEFLQTIDRLGRLIFLYYWKHEDFTSRYGTSDTVEFEDSLRGVFKQLGDLTLKLKQKAIGPEDADTVTV